MDKNTCFEMPDEIPFKKIQKIKINQVKHSNDGFSIQLSRKCEGSLQDQKYIIIRKHSDFKWLLQRLQAQSSSIIILPHLAQSSSFLTSPSSLLTVIANKLFDSKKAQQRTRIDKIIQLQNIKRFLKIIQQLTLPIFNSLENKIQNSIYVFSDQNYQLYQLESFQQVHQEKYYHKNNSSFQFFAQKIGKSGRKLFDIFNITKQQINKILEQEHLIYQNIEKQIKQFYQQLINLQKNLQTIYLNFLTKQNQLKSKTFQIYKINLIIYSIIKYITIIFNQIKQIKSKYQQHSTKNDKQILHKLNIQIQMYSKFIIKQSQQYLSQFQSTLHKFQTLFFQQQIPLQFKYLYQ